MSLKTATAKQRKIECETGPLGRRGGKMGWRGMRKVWGYSYQNVRYTCMTLPKNESNKSF